MTVTLIRLLRRAFGERIRCTESARAVLSSHTVPSSREDVPMPHNRRGLLFAGVAALALVVAGARTAQAQDAVIRGTITSDRGEPIPGATVLRDARRLAAAASFRARITSGGGEPIPGANVVLDELRLGVVSNATGQYSLSIPGARVR